MLAWCGQGGVRFGSPALLAKPMLGLPVVSSNAAPPVVVFLQHQSG